MSALIPNGKAFNRSRDKLSKVSFYPDDEVSKILQVYKDLNPGNKLTAFINEAIKGYVELQDQADQVNNSLDELRAEASENLRMLKCLVSLIEELKREKEQFQSALKQMALKYNNYSVPEAFSGSLAPEIFLGSRDLLEKAMESSVGSSKIPVSEKKDPLSISSYTVSVDDLAEIRQKLLELKKKESQV